MVTLRDIAERLNISISTVSRVLNNDITLKVPESTINKIRLVANELGYVKKNKLLLNKKKYSIGAIMWYTHDEMLKDPYYIEIRQGIERLAVDLNIEVITIYKQKNQTFLLKSISKCEGLIAIGKFSENQIISFEAISPHIVFVDSSPNVNKFGSVVIDFRHAMSQIMDYILSFKETPIAYLGAYEKVEDRLIYGERRKKIFIKSLKKHNLYMPKYIKIGLFTQQSGYTNMQNILKLKAPKIVFCANDSIAFGALKAIHEKKLKVPNDIKVIGFNDNFESNYFTPPLTTLHVSTLQMGEEALISCKQMIKHPKSKPMKKVLPTKLIIRKST